MSILSFVATLDDGSRCYWDVSPSDDYHANVLVGEEYAIELVDLIRSGRSIIPSNIFAKIHRDMSAGSPDNGITIGFWKGIAFALNRP